MISGDVFFNPETVKCESCSRTIALNHRALCCVYCTNHYHMKYGGVKRAEYRRLQRSLEQVWICQL